MDLYEKKYNEALKWMQGLYSGLHGATKEDAEHYFSELKESEDDKIRKEIHIYLDWLDGRKDYQPKGEYTIRDMIAWLEKQGEQPTDKIEPNPKVKDWVILNDTVAQILDKQKYGFVGLDIDGKDFFCNYGHTDSMRLWTIQDAKDGDVLVDEDNNIGLYLEEKDDLYWHSRIYLGCDNCLRGFSIGGYHKHKNTKPATKKQRDLLFQKMKEAGYAWDNEKKELKKIEPKTLDANKVIEWINNQACLGWIEDVEVDKFIEKFKKDFGI